ncbi:MAG: RidA family protein [Pseudomonadota bacterium]
MKQRIINPSDGIFATTPDYVHALEVSSATRQLFVSGTVGVAADGSVPGTLEAQLDLVWANIARILREADMTVANIVRVTSYLTDRAQIEANQDARVRALAGRVVPTTAIVVQTLFDEWLVEVEVVAMA